MRFQALAIGAVIFIIAYFVVGRINPSRESYRESYKGRLSQLAEAKVDLSDMTLNEVNSENKSTLLRYFASSPRWEVRVDHEGAPYALRREKNYKGEYFSGSYTSFELIDPFAKEDYFQIKALISFTNPFGFGNRTDMVTQTKVGTNPVTVIIEEPHSGTPGYSSYLIAKAAAINIEIYEQSALPTRPLTQKIYDEVSVEIDEVLKNNAYVRNTGLLPKSSPYYFDTKNEPYLNIYTSWKTKETDLKSDFLQYGIYTLEGYVCPMIPGIVYAKVINLKDNSFLSETEIMNNSRRIVGWSEDGKTCFPYESEITIGEGGWNTRHNIRVELWHEDHAQTGLTKLTETFKTVSGYEF